MKNDFGSFKRHIWVVPLEVFMFVTAIVMVAQHDWLHVATSLFTFAVSFLPLWVERWFRIRLPAWLQLTYGVFIFASMFMGEVLHLYGQAFWWDDMTHFAYGLLMGFGTALWIELLIVRRRLRMPRPVQIIIVLAMVLSVAGLWEIAEYLSDYFFGTWSQNDSLSDTMLDMIEATAGGIIAAIWYEVYLRGRKGGVAGRAVQSFLKMNPLNTTKGGSNGTN